MSAADTGIDRQRLLDYFLGAAKPRAEWLVGMEVERLARDASSGLPLPYEGDGPSIRGILEFYRARRNGDPIMEATHLIGLDGDYGSITLEPGGQVEWSSRPCRSLDRLKRDLDEHLSAMTATGESLGIDWVAEAVDPVHPVERMEWMPKARYNIMGPFLGAQGRLAHRMMTQTAAIQCAFDYADPDDWLRKFRAAATLAPVATALFANSSHVDGGPSGYRSYRQAIWRETDPDRCGLPAVVFDPGFDIEAWLDWVLQVPTIFRHRARGLVPSGGMPFSELMQRRGCDAIRPEDWETHVSTIFTEVRSYTYIEVRSADLQPPELMFAVPALWTGLLYDDQALDSALELGQPFSKYPQWVEGMEVGARDGLDGRIGGVELRELAERAIALAVGGLERIDADLEPAEALRSLETLARERQPSSP